MMMTSCCVAADYWAPYLLAEPQSTLALKGRRVTLSCTAASSLPHISIHWRKDHEALSERHGKITVSSKDHEALSERHGKITVSHHSM